MNAFSITTCLQMIAHYQAQALNTEKPESWRALARVSVTEWQCKLVRARGFGCVAVTIRD